MWRFLAAVICISIEIYSNPVKAQTPPKGYDITAKTNYRNVIMYLGSYFGTRKVLVDSAIADQNGTAHFRGENRLPMGIYFLVSPQKVILFEMLMDYAEHFNVAWDSTKMGDIKFSGSPDNDLFAEIGR